MDLVRLNKDNYYEAINLMNVVFSRNSGIEKDITKSIPKMKINSEEQANKHFGVFENGKIVACLGVYPFKALVLNEELSFATVGNVVTHWEYEGNGYMSKLLDCSAKELENLNVDIARLSGLRSRYNRYGFEKCGQTYNFTFTYKNRLKKCSEYNSNIEFIVINENDTNYLEFATKLYNKNKINVPRKVENAYLTMSAWLNTPYIAICNGNPIGYLSVNNEGVNIAEIFAVDTKSFIDIICSWHAKVNTSIHFYLQPHSVAEMQFFTSVCENFNLTYPGLFYVRNWEKVVNAFMKLKASYIDMPKGEINIEIRGYGTIKVYVNNNEVGCVSTKDKPDITLDNLTASRYIFGPYSPIYTNKVTALAQSWFPLPLSWNGQDRI
ncbi:MAG: GNAT family N-acetyltransferase [Clostridia bacterium]|nr:GNAT family N-acetyltransferase [Clostridia bacterium]